MPGLKAALMTLWAPARALAVAADERRCAWALALLTAASLVFSALLVTRVDFAGAAEEALDKVPAEVAKMTPHERVEKIESGRKVAVIGVYTGAALGPAFSVLAAALALWLAFKVVAGSPSFIAAFAVTAHASIPKALKQVLALPALWRSSSLSMADVDRIFPSSLAALVPDGMPSPKLALLSSVDLFSLWSVVLVALGMAYVAKVSRVRSAVVVAVLWASFVLVVRFALPILSQASH